MDREESREELNCKIRKNLCDLFGPFDEFTERLSRGVKHGLIRSKMKSRSSPFVSLHMTHESPSHIPVQVALQSMRNLVEKPLSALPMDFPGGLIAAKGVETSGDRSGKNGKRRKMSEDEGVAMKRKKDQKNAKSAVREKEDAFSPDSGVHSTENDIDESSTVETMLSIMTSLEEPRLSPIPINFKDLERGKKEEKSKKNEPKNSKFPTGSSTSSATTSRESSPGSTKRKDAAARQSLSKECVTGQIKLKNLKPEKVKKLLDLAKKLGKLIEENKEEKREREKTPPEKEKEPKKHRTIQMLTRDAPKLSPAAAAPSPRSAINTPTPSILSRPSSSLSTHEPIQGGTPKASTHEKSSARNPQAVKQPTRWTCQWEHTKLETIQRVPLPDPADHKFKSIGEFYHALAKDWKSQADKSKDRVVRPLNYILSSVYFLMEAIKKVEKERTPKAMMTCASIYRDTYELLGVAVFQGIRETDDAFAAHILPRIKILGQIMLSVMQYQMYLFRSEQAMKTFSRLERREVTECIEVRSVPSHSQSDSTPSLPNKLINTVVAHGTTSLPSTSSGSTPSSTVATGSQWIDNIHNCQTSVTMPQVVFDAYRSQIKTANLLFLASRYWEDSKNLAKIVDGGFIKHVETVCGKSIGMDIPFELLAQFVLTAVGSLKAEYEAEKKQPVRPELAKMKPALDIAIRTGMFHTMMTDRQQRPSHTHTTSTRTPVANATNSK